ncbi:hypothetical protein F66182_3325 [Fusarium sp. NRRL 66182]|nr:hypothetical protein F66182_3325 [Fusarium sp. NRRL 66182]
MEPAVRHSVVAISLLYEQLPRFSAHLPSDQDQHRERLILSHYNAAISQLRPMTSPEKVPLVLVVCILFIGIEMLRSNTHAAIQHCKHGIQLLANCADYQWINQHVQPVYRRLSLFPYFFGHRDADYPSLGSLCSPATQPQPFTSLLDAQCMMDNIYSRTIRLMRLGDAYRFGKWRNELPAKELLDEQREVNTLLDTWQSLFSTLQQSSLTPEEKRSQMACPWLLAARRDKCRIAINMAFETDETGYDKYLETFKRIKRILGKVASSLYLENVSSRVSTEDTHLGTRPVKFTFEMAWTPIVSFSALKCRDLDTRLGLWRLLPVVGYPRESLWEMSLIIPMLGRVIEMEHGLPLDAIDAMEDTGLVNLPPDLQRIKHVWVESAPTHMTVNGKTMMGREVGFSVVGDDGDVHPNVEFLDETGYL